MHKRIAILFPLLLAALSFIACTTASATPPPTDTPQVVDGQGVDSTSLTRQGPQLTPERFVSQSGTTTPTGIPTPPPLMTVWPLEADLYYLNDAGQVWKQPLLGDESAAAAVTQLDVTVRDFAVAPGGEWLMYRTDEYVAVSSVNGQSGQLIADSGPMPLAGVQSQQMAWSPDASKLAYVNPAGFEVYIPGAGPDFGPLVYSISEKPVRELGWSKAADWLLVWRQDNTAALYNSKPEIALWVELGGISSFKWLKDGRLAFAPVEGGLAVLNPADLNSRQFIVPQDRLIDLIGERPDGTLTFFVQGASLDDAGMLHLADPVSLDFHQESGVQVNTRDKMWNPVATRLISLNASDPTGKTLMLLDPATGATASFQAAGQAVAMKWADPPPQSVTGLGLPNDLFFISPEAGVLQVWRLPKNGNTPQAVSSATADVTDYDISPDGTQILYTSGGIIYRQVIGTLDVTPLVSGSTNASTGNTPAFSPTGRQVAYANGGIWITDLDTGQSNRLVADNVPKQASQEREVIVYSDPQWSPDGNWLLVRAGYYEGSDFALLSVSGVPRTPIYLNMFVADGTWTEQNTALIFSGGGAYSTPGLTIVQPATQPTLTQVLTVPVVDATTRADDRIVFLRIPNPSGIGPTSVRLYSMLPDGTDQRAESSSFVIEQPQLSPNGVMIAGLVQARVGEFGGMAGRLAVANPGTGEIFLIEGVGSVRDVMWGH